MIKPGVTFGEMADYIDGFGANQGMKTVMQLHGCGYGDDGPLFGAENARRACARFADAKRQRVCLAPFGDVSGWEDTLLLGRAGACN